MPASARAEVVLVFGSINTDLVVYLRRLPYPGETVSGGSFSSFPGGKGANAAVAAARSGATVRMYGAVGGDSFGTERIRSLAGEGIDTSGIVVKRDTRSGVAQIWVDERGENSIAVAPGANARFAVADVASLPPLAANERGVASFQNEVPQETTEALIGRCKDLGYATVWNIAPECSAVPSRATLDRADYLVFNENEVRAFLRLLEGETRSSGASAMGVEEAASLARRLLARGASSAIVTLGRAGSVLVSADRTLHQPAFEVEPVDTVGAGDCYCGVLAASLAAGLDAPAAMLRSAAAAAISVTRRGAQTSMPTGAEIDGFLRSRTGSATGPS